MDRIDHRNRDDYEGPIEIALVGQNLFGDDHLEWMGSPAPIGRNLFVTATLRR